MKSIFFLFVSFFSTVGHAQSLDTIFFNAYWNKTTNRDSIKFYRLTKMIVDKDTFYDIVDYYLNGVPQMKGRIKNLSIEEKKWEVSILL